MTETLAPRTKGGLESDFMTWQERVDAALAPVFAEFRALPWIDQIREAPELDAAFKGSIRENAEQRRVAVRQIVAEGWSLTDVAHETGLSTNRILQIEKGKERG